jgi:ubiquinone/menaquinone biosynthesis C-methylase UbiE
MTRGMESFVKHISDNIPDRFEWAIELLRINPSHRILEIGCGTGILAEQVCKTLSAGSLTAIDRSEDRIQQAVNRNDRFIISGIADFRTAEFASLDLPAGAYDTIIAFNVNFFWSHASVELNRVHQLLKPGGKLFVFYQPPAAEENNILAKIKESISQQGFRILSTETEVFEPAPAYCIIAVPC